MISRIVVLADGSYTGFVLPKSRQLPESEAVDDYLKAILELSGDDQKVSSGALAERLGVRAASVTGMLQKLAALRPPLVLYQKHQGVTLSAAGKRRAWELVRHHRLLELFLHDVLKYSWDEVHEEAERLEHFISERFEDRVAAILGDPKFDPHGHLIPGKYEENPARDESPLREWSAGRPAVVTSVQDRDPAILRELARAGITPGTAIDDVQKGPSGSIRVRLKGHASDMRLSGEVAAAVSVQALEAGPERPAGLME